MLLLGCNSTNIRYWYKEYDYDTAGQKKATTYNGQMEGIDKTKRKINVLEWMLVSWFESGGRLTRRRLRRCVRGVVRLSEICGSG